MEVGWKDKPLHGKYPISASDPDGKSSLTHRRLASSGLKSETEGFIIAAQNQNLPTRKFQAKILVYGADPKCRVCDKHTETIGHLVSGCLILAPTEYLNRHDGLGQSIHWCQSATWWDFWSTILWDLDINTDRIIQAKRPDISVKSHHDKACSLIDMSVPSDINISLKIFEKLSRYEDLELEVTKIYFSKQ